MILKNPSAGDILHYMGKGFKVTKVEPLPQKRFIMDERGLRLKFIKQREEDVMDKPIVICLCGSTRFADHHAIMRWELEKQGAIVLMINYLPAWYAESQGWDGHDHFGEKAGLKEYLDELHLRKIDLSDKVIVINVDGYIGDSTSAEIRYAKITGKSVEYLEPLEQTTPATPINHLKSSSNTP